MRVAFDAVMLTMFFKPSANPPVSIPDAQRRIEHLIDTLSAERSKIVIPTPMLGEFLIYAADDGATYLAEMADSDVFEICPFCERAAIEAASLIVKAKQDGDKRGGAPGTWQKVKIDWQLVAIAKVNEVDCVYSDDRDLVAMCATAGIQRKGIADLPVPPPEQMSLDTGGDQG
jgi:hypothetical protein